MFHFVGEFKPNSKNSFSPIQKWGFIIWHKMSNKFLHKMVGSR